MTSLLPYQLNLIASGARPMPFWTSGRRMGKSWQAELVREYCERHGIKVIETNKYGINDKEATAAWHDEYPESWVTQKFTYDSKPIWFGFDLAALGD